MDRLFLTIFIWYQIPWSVFTLRSEKIGSNEENLQSSRNSIDVNISCISINGLRQKTLKVTRNQMWYIRWLNHCICFSFTLNLHFLSIIPTGFMSQTVQTGDVVYLILKNELIMDHKNPKEQHHLDFWAACECFDFRFWEIFSPPSERFLICLHLKLIDQYLNISYGGLHKCGTRILTTKHVNKNLVTVQLLNKIQFYHIELRKKVSQSQQIYQKQMWGRCRGLLLSL